MTKAVQDRMVEVARLRDAFHAAIFSTPNLEAAMALATTGCTLVQLPSGTGASGKGLRRYLAEDVLPHLPADLTFRWLSPDRRPLAGGPRRHGQLHSRHRAAVAAARPGPHPPPGRGSGDLDRDH